MKKVLNLTQTSTTVDVEDKDSEDANRFTDNFDTKDDSENIELLVLDTVPKRWKTQATRLKSYNENKTDIHWSPKVELVLKNSVIPKTHVLDLINGLLRKERRHLQDGSN